MQGKMQMSTASWMLASLSGVMALVFLITIVYAEVDSKHVEGSTAKFDYDIDVIDAGFVYTWSGTQYNVQSSYDWYVENTTPTAIDVATHSNLYFWKDDPDDGTQCVQDQDDDVVGHKTSHMEHPLAPAGDPGDSASRSTTLEWKYVTLADDVAYWIESTAWAYHVHSTVKSADAEVKMWECLGDSCPDSCP